MSTRALLTAPPVVFKAYLLALLRSSSDDVDR